MKVIELMKPKVLSAKALTTNSDEITLDLEGCKIDRVLLERVQHYCTETEKSFESCLSESLDLWLDIIADTELESRRENGIDRDQGEQLLKLSSEIGVSVAHCRGEAVSEWLECVAPAKRMAVERVRRHEQPKLKLVKR